MARDQALHVVAGHRVVVAAHHEDVVGAPDGALGDHHGVPGAELPRLLDEHRPRRDAPGPDGVAHVVGAVAHHDDHLGRLAPRARPAGRATGPACRRSGAAPSESTDFSRLPSPAASTTSASEREVVVVCATARPGSRGTHGPTSNRALPPLGRVPDPGTNPDGAGSSQLEGGPRIADGGERDEHVPGRVGLEQALRVAPGRPAPAQEERQPCQRDRSEHQGPCYELRHRGPARSRPIPRPEREELPPACGDGSEEPQGCQQPRPHPQHRPNDHHPDRHAAHAPPDRDATHEPDVVNRDEERDRQRRHIVEPTGRRSHRPVERETP